MPHTHPSLVHTRCCLSMGVRPGRPLSEGGGLRAQAGLPARSSPGPALGCGTGGAGAFPQRLPPCSEGALRTHSPLSSRGHTRLWILPVPREARGSLLHDSLQPVRYRQKRAQRRASASPGSHSKKGVELGAQGSGVRRIKGAGTAAWVTGPESLAGQDAPALPRLRGWGGGTGRGHGPLCRPTLWSSGEGCLQLEGETAGLSMGGGERSRPCPEVSGVQVRHPRDLLRWDSVAGEVALGVFL